MAPLRWMGLPLQEQVKRGENWTRRKMKTAPKPKVKVHNIQDSGLGSSGTETDPDPDPETSCPDTSVKGPRPAAGSEAIPTLIVERDHGDMDDRVLATPGGTGDPGYTVCPMNPAAATQLSDLLQRSVQKSIKWDLTQQRPLLRCFTKEDWVQQQDEDIVLHRVKHLIKQAELGSIKDGMEIPEVTRLCRDH